MILVLLGASLKIDETIASARASSSCVRATGSLRSWFVASMNPFAIATHRAVVAFRMKETSDSPHQAAHRLAKLRSIVGMETLTEL